MSEKMMTIPLALRTVEEMSKAEFDEMIETGLTQAKNG